MRAALYPSGMPQMTEIFTSSGKVFYPNTNLDDLSAERIEFLFRFYLQVFITKVIVPAVSKLRRDSSNEAVVRQITEFPPEIVVAGIDAVLPFIYEQMPELEKRDNDKKKMAQMIAEQAGANKGLEELHIDDPEYGLVPEKPIFTAGIDEEYDFATRLISSDGRELEYERMGSRFSKGAATLIDIFSFTYADGSPKGSVYLCMYSDKTSTKAPQGFELRDYVLIPAPSGLKS